MKDSEIKAAFRLMARTWGEKEGHVFLPWIDGNCKNREERKSKYREGRGFEWPNEREAILEHMKAHTKDDLYWCPNVFLEERRVSQYVDEETALWADLDQVDPREIDLDLQPTICWETSPGRYQGVWLLEGFAMMASTPEGGNAFAGLNQRLTYYLEADLGGWDATQLLRPPGWSNHKPDYRREYGGPVKGKIIWRSGPRHDPVELHGSLPKVSAGSYVQSEDVLAQDIDQVNRLKVLSEHRAKLPLECKDLIKAKDTGGADRSAKLFYIERCLAEVGCTLTEIVAIVQPTVWNKFDGRNDELKRLSIEAAKAIEETRRKARQKETEGEEADDGLEVYDDLDPAERLTKLVHNIPPPHWLVNQIWNEGSCGIMAGSPKSFKSFIALDLAFSVATGAPFLGEFKVQSPGPVLYIQEEDTLHLLKKRLGQIADGRAPQYHPDGWITMRNGEVVWGEAKELDIYAKVRSGIQLDDELYREWLDEELNRRDYQLCILDPMGVAMGQVNENSYGELNHDFLTPLKQLAEKYGTALLLVHHTRKAEHQGRRGATLLGSQAAYGWVEDWIHLEKKGGDRSQRVELMRESKTSETLFLNVNTNLKGGRVPWRPLLVEGTTATGEPAENRDGEVSSKLEGIAAYRALRELGAGAHAVSTIIEEADVKKQTVYTQLNKLTKQGHIHSPRRGYYTMNGDE